MELEKLVMHQPQKKEETGRKLSNLFLFLHTENKAKSPS